MDFSKLKSFGFIASLVVTILGLLMTQGIFGLSGAVHTIVGYILTIAPLLGVHMLSTSGTPPAPPAA